MKALNQYEETVVAPGFDAVAAAYGEVAFLQRTAEALVEVLPRAPIESALDVATGPGTTAILLASRWPTAQVTGIDLSADMLETARARGRSVALKNLSFARASAIALPFDGSRFDLVTCSSAIYYMPDLMQAVTEWTRVLRPQGTLAFSTFGDGVLEPMSSLFDARMRAYGIVVPQPTPLYRLTSTGACAHLLEGARLDDIRIERRQVGYRLADAESWWTTLMSTGFRLLVDALDEERRAAFELEHKEEVRGYEDDRGLWLEVPAIIATGVRPD